MFGTVGRATVPSDTGRHGGRPYDSTRSKFFSSIKLAAAQASGSAHMKHEVNSELQNVEYRLQLNLPTFSTSQLHTFYFFPDLRPLSFDPASIFCFYTT
jgi:hypothetical protein